MTKIVISVPRSSSEDATEQLAKDIFIANEKGEYSPVKIKLTNKVHRNVGLPEIGVTMGSCLDAENAVKTVRLKHPDELIALVSSIEQIALVNGIDDLIDIEADKLVVEDNTQQKKATVRKTK